MTIDPAVENRRVAPPLLEFGEFFQQLFVEGWDWGVVFLLGARGGAACVHGFFDGFGGACCVFCLLSMMVRMCFNPCLK